MQVGHNESYSEREEEHIEFALAKVDVLLFVCHTRQIDGCLLSGHVACHEVLQRGLFLRRSFRSLLCVIALFDATTVSQIRYYRDDVIW